MSCGKFNRRSWVIPTLAIMILIGCPALGDSETNDVPGCPVGGYSAVNCPIRSDAVIRQIISARLAGAVSSPCNPIGVDVQCGVVMLTGQVDTAGKRQLAGILASSVRGVTCVSNQMTICPEALTDQRLVGMIRKALSRIPMNTRQVVVYVKNGVAQLTGSVATDYGRDMVGQAAASVPGVASVQNNITVIDVTGNF